MTSMVNEMTASVAANGSDPLLPIDALAVVLLIVLLVESELVRAHAHGAGAPRIRVLHVAAAPLLVAFVLIVVVRALNLR